MHDTHITKILKLWDGKYSKRIFQGQDIQISCLWSWNFPLLFSNPSTLCAWNNCLCYNVCYPALIIASWAILFSHPRDFTPVCTTELGQVVQKEAEFKKRGVKLIALSCDSVEDHKAWSKVHTCLFIQSRHHILLTSLWSDNWNILVRLFNL